MYQNLAFHFGFLLFVYLVYSKVRRTKSENSKSILWASLPTVGVSPEFPIPWFWATLGSITRTADWVAHGYVKFSKELNSPFALPRAGYGAIVVLPPSHINLLNKPEDDLIAYNAQVDVLQPKYMMSRSAIYDNPIHFEIVRKHFARDVGQFAPLTAEELDVAFCKYWGNDVNEWKTVNVWDTCTKVICQASNRALFGLPFCRDESLLEKTTAYSASVYQGAALISSMPQVLKPIFAPFFSRSAKKQLRYCQKILVPMVEERLKKWDRGTSNMPSDALQWMIERCSKCEDRAEMEPANIAERLLNINIVSSWTTSYAFAYCILDLYGSPHRNDFVEGLRVECESVSHEFDGLKSKAAIDKLHRVDSAVKESLRISPFTVVAFPRIVAPGGGLALNDHSRLPPETRISFPFRDIHHDPDNYENPLEYDAFRFSRKFEGPKGSTITDEARDLSVSYNAKYIPYGYGKHACPGRWFASQILKQALSYLIQNYEVECVKAPTERKVIFNAVLPPENAQIIIRRRQNTA